VKPLDALIKSCTGSI